MDIQRLDSVGAPTPGPAATAVGDVAGQLAGPHVPAPPAPAAVHDSMVHAGGPAIGAAGSAQSSYYTQYQIDLKSHVVSVQLVDQATGFVVRQIPSEALARFAASWDAYVGKLLDHQT